MHEKYGDITVGVIHFTSPLEIC